MAARRHAPSFPNLQRGFPPGIRQPVNSGNPCRQGHESLRSNFRNVDFVLTVNYDECDLFRALWQLWIIFSIFISDVCAET